MQTGRLMLLDTAALYFRAYYGVPESVTAPDGTPVNAVRGLMDFISRLVTERQPDRLVACLDADWRPEFRVALLPSYKAHRVAVDDPTGEIEEVPDTLSPQVEVINEMLDAFGIARVGMDGYEADDVIGTLTTRASGPVDIVTGDRDLFQLVDDEAGVRVLYTAKGVAKAEVFDEAAVSAKYGIPGQAYADFATLRGDPSDGLPGVPGIGDKTAASLLTRFGSLEAVLVAARDGDAALAPAVRNKLVAAADYLAVAPTVVNVARDLELPAFDDALPAAPRDSDLVEDLAERWGLRSPATRLTAALAAAHA